MAGDRSRPARLGYRQSRRGAGRTIRDSRKGSLGPSVPLPGTGRLAESLDRRPVGRGPARQRCRESPHAGVQAEKSPRTGSLLDLPDRSRLQAGRAAALCRCHPVQHARRPLAPGRGVEGAHPRHVAAPCARTLARTAPGGAGQRPLRAAPAHRARSERGSVRWRSGSRPISLRAPVPSSWRSSRPSCQIIRSTRNCGGI